MNGWQNLRKAREARRQYRLMDQQQRQADEQQLEFQRQREAKREMLRRWGIDPDQPRTTFNDDLSRLRGI
jgi:hypothetical protein